jgi:Flp pilus assembly protein TadD
MPANSSNHPRQDRSISAETPALEIALQHHQAGQYTRAEKIYNQLLARNPDHADALHLLGMLRFATGNTTEAEKLIRRAITVEPRQPVFHSNLGIVLAAARTFDAAIAEYRLADSLGPPSPENLNNLGVALHASGAAPDAIDCFKRAVILKPDYIDARNNLLTLWHITPDTAAAHHAIGDLLHDADRSIDAIYFYRKAIELHPESAETFSNLGNALFATGEHAEALLCFEQALKLSPCFPQALNNLANVLKEFGRFDEAIAAYQQAVTLQPQAPEPLNNLANALRETGNWDSAISCYQQAMSLNPENPITHNNIGNAFCERGDWPAAITCYEQALALKPDFADAINNLGTALEETGHRDRAMACYLRARQLTPRAVSPPWNIALLQLLQGDYTNGWPGYENRWRQKKQRNTWRSFTQPMLEHVSQIHGSRILLHAEQGFGDVIQFCRYASLVADHGATVFLECQPELVRLLRSLPGVHSVIARQEQLPEFDLHCPLMSLPRVFKTTLASVPAAVPYLHADPADVGNWKAKFATEPDAFRVGLVWAGQATHQKDRDRSLPLAAFAALGNLSGARFYSLQIGAAAAQAELPPIEMSLVNWTGELHDFADTAALVTQLDLVIAVDTAVCHLAGAAGVPVWVLLAYQPDWRWLLDREDSPWYPHTRLFRQPTPGNWAEPLARLASALSKMLETSSPQSSIQQDRSRPHQTT